MNKSAFIIFMLLAFLSACQVSQQTEPVNESHYLFSSFRGNGQDGLHLAYSKDGLNWNALNQDRSFIAPQIGGKLMRDPCIIKGPDDVFHMVWTTGWQDTGIGIAHSKDLIHWSEQRFLPVMKNYPLAKNAWAPEIFWDEKSQQYLIYWASTITGQYPETEKSADKGWDHRIYATTTKDFVNYSDTQLFYQPDFNVIDATITSFDKAYVMVLKDETRYPPAKNLKVAFSESVNGPWQLAEGAFSPRASWVEGPTILATPQGYYVYFDQYTDHRYGVMFTEDFIQWQDMSQRLHMPIGSRHGSVLNVKAKILNKLLALP